MFSQTLKDKGVLFLSSSCFSSPEASTVLLEALFGVGWEMGTGDHPPTPQVGCSSKRGTSEVTFFSGFCRLVDFYFVLLVVSTPKGDHTILFQK